MCSISDLLQNLEVWSSRTGELEVSNSGTPVGPLSTSPRAAFWPETNLLSDQISAQFLVVFSPELEIWASRTGGVKNGSQVQESLQNWREMEGPKMVAR